jgi:hypothetical protein
MPGHRFPAPWSSEEHAAHFVVRDNNGQAIAYVYYENKAGRRSAAKLLTKRRGAPDRCKYCQAARPIAKDIMCSWWCHATENTTMQQLQLGIFVAAMIAIVVCGCIFTRKPKKGY